MKTKIPLPILLFSGFLVLFGVYVTFSAFTNPSAVVTGFVADTAANQLMQGMWASRILSMVVVLGAALLLRSPNLLALALLMRLVTEVFDTLALVNTGGFSAMTVVLLVIAALELACIVWLVQLQRSAQPQ